MMSLEECIATRNQLLIDRSTKVSEFETLKLNGDPTIETYNILALEKININNNYTKKIHECNIKIQELTITDENIQANLVNVKTMISAITPF